MSAFEVIGMGFDGGTDAPDDRVLWVYCDNEQWLRESLKGTYVHNCTLMKQELEPHEYDFIMPKDVQALHDRLRALAGIPLLSQMDRGDVYYHPKYGDVTFIASDPDDGAYLICKYWDRDEDEQKYFGCEASDLRFIVPVTPTGVT